jgi:hypothetical protein
MYLGKYKILKLFKESVLTLCIHDRSQKGTIHQKRKRKVAKPYEILSVYNNFLSM